MKEPHEVRVDLQHRRANFFYVFKVSSSITENDYYGFTK